MLKIGTIVTAILLLGTACTRQLPNEIYKAYELDWKLVTENDRVYMLVRNPLASPLAFTLRSKNRSFNAAMQEQIPRLLKPYEQIKLPFPKEWSVEELQQLMKPYSVWSRLKSVVPDTSVRYLYPFPKGQRYSIIQAYGGAFSHRKSAFANFAIDFDLAVGDTVCAAWDGVVVGLIEDNKDWIHGPSSRYREYANYLRLYHADETYTDYVHLKYKGALVAMGDTVRAGQPIGISGYTGWTSTPHLHFNAIMPTDTGTLVGFPVRFEKLSGRDIKQGMRVGHD